MTEHNQEDHKHEHAHEEHKAEHKHDSKHYEHQTKKRIKFDNVIVAVAVLLGIILLITNIMTFGLNQEIKANIAESAEKSRPGLVELSVIKDSKCKDCFDVNQVVAAIKNSQVNITKESSYEIASSEAKALISKYDIKKLPAVVLTGEIDKIAMEILVKKDDALLFSDAPAPYVNASNGRVQGLVSVYILKDPECTQCADLSALLEQIKGVGMKTSQEKIVDPASAEGKSLVEKYRISNAPSLVLSKDASAYPIVMQAWPQVGSIEKDGSFVLRMPYPPFKNLTTGDLKGVISVIYLGDESCTECYDVMQHEQILTSPNSFALKFEKSEKIDASDAPGKALIAEYNITQIPTVLITGDIGIYPSANSLKQFFSAEKDGTFVFRRLSVVGTYRELSTGDVINPQQGQ